MQMTSNTITQSGSDVHATTVFVFFLIKMKVVTLAVCLLSEISFERHQTINDSHVKTMSR